MKCNLYISLFLPEEFLFMTFTTRMKLHEFSPLNQVYQSIYKLGTRYGKRLIIKSKSFLKEFM